MLRTHSAKSTDSAICVQLWPDVAVKYSVYTTIGSTGASSLASYYTCIIDEEGSARRAEQIGTSWAQTSLDDQYQSSSLLLRFADVAIEKASAMLGNSGWTMMVVNGVGVLCEVKLWPLFVLTYTPLSFCVPLCQGNA